MNDKPETQSEVSPKDAKFWLCEIEAAQSRNNKWYESAEEADERYRDDEDCNERNFGGLNVFWSNVETQKAAIGEDFGKPQVSRVNMPENDGGLARHVAMIWERAVEGSVKDADDNHDIALAVGDVFVPGNGQVWLEVEADGKDWVTAELCRICFRDYLEGPSTRWGSVPWVARRHFFTADELVSECKMSKEGAEKVPMNVTLPHSDKKEASSAEGKEQFKRAEVWEIWSKFPEKGRVFVAVGYNDAVLRYDKDPLGVKGFFPCPRPMRANGDEGKPPLTDFSRYRDQADELDRVSERIFVLTETLRRTGIHDKAFKELADMAEAEENTTIAVENWAALQAAGGLNKVQEWQDIVPIAQVLGELHKQRDTLMRLIYELSGISDLARGHTDPDETLGAQKLKQSFGSNRFKRREKESRRFASDAYQIKAEVIAELFPREQLEQMTGIQMPLRKDIDSARKQLTEIMRIQQGAEQARQALAQLQQASQQPPQPGQPPRPQPTPQQLMQLQQQAQTPPPNNEQLEYLTNLAQVRWSWEDISGVLRSDTRRCYTVEVETDQTAFVDQEADKQNRTQFFGIVMDSLLKIGPMIAGNPKNGEVFKQLVMFVISAFKSGRGMEEGIEQAIDGAIEQISSQQGQQQQDPAAAMKMQEGQIKIQIAQIQLQKEQVQLQQAQVEAQQAGVDIQVQQFTAQAKVKEGQQKLIQGEKKIEQQERANQAKTVEHELNMRAAADKVAFQKATQATAEEALLRGPTRSPTNGEIQQ